MTVDENGFQYYKCRFCGLFFNYIGTLRAHERVHDVDQPFVCAKCGEAFHYMCQLEHHGKQHSKGEGYKCECGRNFFNYTDLLYHRHPGEDDEVAVHVPQPSPSSIVPIVPLQRDETVPRFALFGTEPKHPIIRQGRDLSDIRHKPYICQYCSKSYADSRGLAYHMYGHRGERIFNPRASRYLMGRAETTTTYISSGYRTPAAYTMDDD